MNEKFIMETVDNLQTESEHLNFKMKKAREDENWGTYKNIVQAYEKILDLLARYNVKPIKVVNLEDELINEYNSTKDVDRIIELIKKEYNIYDVTDMSPEQEYKANKLIEKCLLKVLDNKLKSDISWKYVAKHGGYEVKFNVYSDNDFIVEKVGEQRKSLGHSYNTCLTIGLNEYTLDVGSTSISNLLNKEYDIFVFILKIVNGYYNKILELIDDMIKQDKDNTINTICIGLSDRFIIKKYNNYMKIKFELGIGGTANNFSIIN